MDWINLLPENMQAEVRKVTKDLKLVDSNSGDWVPASKISELSKKHKTELENSTKELKELKDKLSSMGDYDTIKSDLESKSNEISKLTLSHSLANTLRGEGAEYPEVLINQVELKEGIDFDKTVKDLKDRYPLYFKGQTITSAGSINNSGPPLTNEELRQQKINETLNKPTKTFQDFANVLNTMNKKE